MPLIVRSPLTCYAREILFHLSYCVLYTLVPRVKLVRVYTAELSPWSREFKFLARENGDGVNRLTSNISNTYHDFTPERERFSFFLKLELESDRPVLWLCFTTPTGYFEYHALLSLSTNQKKNQNQPRLACTCSPRFPSATCTCFEF